jgi:tRNA dimethylallyltransferase
VPAGADTAAPVIILTGPTGAGKSAWAERLAARFPVEIVSVDSALVYRGMDIGTAKPPRAVRERIPHHLIDILDPEQSYSAGQFAADAASLIAAIRGRGRLPLLVGGTMLYLRALLWGIAELPQGSSELRRAIDARGLAEGWPALHAELERLDPEAASRIHPNDPQRIQRALEVCYLTGQPLSQLQRGTRGAAIEPTLRVALAPADRSTLHAEITRRFAQMMEQGLLEEVTALRERPGLTAEHPSMRAVGYRQLWAHLSGEYALDEAVRRAIAATRQLAKRQLTWLRADRGIEWIDPQGLGAYDNFEDRVAGALRQSSPREASP